MSVVGHQAPPIFKRGIPPTARLTLYVALSIALLVLDLRFRYLETVRQGLTVLSYPLQIAASTPAEWAKRSLQYFSSLSSLQRENAQLRAASLKNAQRLLRQDGLEHENTQLRELVGLSTRPGLSGVAAEVIYSSRDPFSRRVIIDRGSHAGVQKGQPVIDGQGVVGQVTRSFPLQAEVTLLTDREQAIPVKVLRNGLRAVMFGGGKGLLELRYLASNADVEPGDTILTSGLDGVYVPDLPVGKVVHVDRDEARGFARFLCQPLAGVERSTAVLVLARNKALPPRPEDQPAEAAAHAPASAPAATPGAKP